MDLKSESPGPITVLYLSAVAKIGGAERVLVQLAKNLAQPEFRLILLTQDEGPLTAAFRDLGHRVILQTLPAWRKLKFVCARYATVRKLAGHAQREGVDMIHCNNYRLAPYAVSLRNAVGLPHFIHLHDCLNARLIRNFCLNRAQMIVGVSRYVLEPFSSGTQKHRVIYNGITPERFAASTDLRSSWGIGDDVRTVGIIGAFTENKRHDLFLQIAAELKKLMSRVMFVVVGDDVWNSGVSKADLQRAAADLGLAEDVLFTGWVKDIPAVLQSLDAMVLPSRTDSFPLSVLEAMASGCLVFAHAEAGGPKEQITDGQDGFLVDCGQPQGCAQRIADVLAQPDRCRDVRQSARDKVQRCFSTARFVGAFREIYQELGAQGKAGQ